MPNFNESLTVQSPLPIARFGGMKRLWIKLQAAGLLKLAGFTREPVQIDAYRILGTTYGKPLIRVSLSCKGIPAGASSTVSISNALHRAFGEFCECLQVFNENHVLGQTRSGFATAADEDTARTRAYCELIERDSLITHFLCPEVRAFPLPRPEYAALPVKIARLWSADPTVQIILCGLQDSPDAPWFLGAAAGWDTEVTVEKAYADCVTVYCGYRNVATTVSAGSRQALVLKHIQSSKDPVMKNSIEAIFNGFGTVQPDFETSIASAVFQTRARLGKSYVVVSATHLLLCRLTFGQLWEDSEQETIGLLKGRNLNPVWGVHPFA
jgi:hypothetical protein